MDSDRSSADADINETKKRVRGEFDKGPGFAWITEGREVENYVPPELIETAVKKAHSKAKELIAVGQFDHCYCYTTTDGESETKNIDKVKIAHEVADSPARLDVLDLEPMIHKLIEFVRQSNRLEAR